MNAQTAHTPRTDAAQSHCVEPPSTYVVSVSFARTLERENAQLVERNERMRQALEELKEPLTAYVHGDIEITPHQINQMLATARAALNPPPTK